MYSLFAVPTGQLRLKLQRTIESLGGPIFVPHLTLAGPITLEHSVVLDRARQLSRSQKKFFVKFLDVSYKKTSYYQCVFIECATTEDLMKAHEEAGKLFELEEVPFQPHVSLVYSDMDEDQRREMVKQVSKMFYEGEEGNEDQMLHESGYWVEEIEVWEINPEDKQLRSWKKLEALPLLSN